MCECFFEAVAHGFHTTLHVLYIKTQMEMCICKPWNEVFSKDSHPV